MADSHNRISRSWRFGDMASDLTGVGLSIGSGFQSLSGTLAPFFMEVLSTTVSHTVAAVASGC